MSASTVLFHETKQENIDQDLLIDNGRGWNLLGSKDCERKPNYFICEGDWTKFVLHHQLKQGDVLLFFIIEKSMFHVQA